MRQISTYDAKNKLSELIDSVAAGESIEITRRGKPAARLVPVPVTELHFSDPAEAANWLRNNRTHVSREEVAEAIREGRR